MNVAACTDAGPEIETVDAASDERGEGETMKENTPALNLEVEEIERRERGHGSCTSSTTSRLCTCRCIFTTASAAGSTT